MLSLPKQNSQGIGSKHRSCFCAVLVLLPLEASRLFKVIPATEILLNAWGALGTQVELKPFCFLLPLSARKSSLAGGGKLSLHNFIHGGDSSTRRLL